jgi:hypothetical protein
MSETIFNRRTFLDAAAGVGFVVTLAGDTVNVETASARTGPVPPSGLWDYSANPVSVKNPDLPIDALAEARLAFDGYGGSRRADSVARCWIQKPSSPEQKPISCIIDFGTPVGLSKFVHYFYTPRIKDYRPDPFLVSSAFSSINISRSDDGANWRLAQRLEDLTSEWPQVFTLSHPEPARYYKLEIAELVPEPMVFGPMRLKALVGRLYIILSLTWFNLKPARSVTSKVLSLAQTSLPGSSFHLNTWRQTLS